MKCGWCVHRPPDLLFDYAASAEVRAALAKFRRNQPETVLARPDPRVGA